MKRLIATMAAIVATGLIACGSSIAKGSASSASTPGVTATSITFGTHQPMTGPAAPGYSLIAPASQAYFDYVNAHGGVYGRKIHLIIKNDEYDPTQTVNVVHQLVLQDNVFGIFEGLGTPTHTKVVGFLNAEKVPDAFVSSGCDCWDNGKSQPMTTGWFTNYTIEGKILGSYIKSHFAGKKIGVLYQDDDLGKGGIEGLDDAGLKSDIVSEQPYQSGTSSLATQMTALKSSGAQVLVEFTVPIYTAIARITSYTLGYSPQLVVSNIGIDPTTLAGLLKSVSKGKVSGDALMDGTITDGYLPSSSDLSNKWVAFFHKIQEKYDPKAPWDLMTQYGEASAYTLVQALVAAGKNLTRQDFVDAINKYGKTWAGPGLVPFRYTTTEHGGYAGVQLGKVENSKLVMFGKPMVTEPNASSPITPYTGTQPAPPASGVPTVASVTK